MYITSMVAVVDVELLRTLPLRDRDRLSLSSSDDEKDKTLESLRLVLERADSLVFDVEYVRYVSTEYWLGEVR